MNIVSLLGRLVTDPETRQTPSGATVTSFTLAVDRAYVKQGEERQTDFLECIGWNKTGEFISRYFSKGQRIAIVGRIQTRNYTDKEGKKRNAFEIVVENAHFCESKRDIKAEVREAFNKTTTENFTAVEDDSDLPF